MEAGAPALIGFIAFITLVALKCEALFCTAARKLHTHACVRRCELETADICLEKYRPEIYRRFSQVYGHS